MKLEAYSRLTEDVIAELQAAVAANPGIRCVVRDDEWGPNAPKVEVALVYVNEHNHVIITDEEKIKQVEQTIKEYTEQTPEQGWAIYSADTEYEGMWKTFAEYKEGHDLVLNSSIQELKEMKTAVPTVVISMR